MFFVNDIEFFLNEKKNNFFWTIFVSLNWTHNTHKCTVCVHTFRYEDKIQQQQQQQQYSERFQLAEMNNGIGLWAPFQNKQDKTKTYQKNINPSASWNICPSLTKPYIHIIIHCLELCFTSAVLNNSCVVCRLALNKRSNIKRSCGQKNWNIFYSRRQTHTEYYFTQTYI